MKKTHLVYCQASRKDSRLPYGAVKCQTVSEPLTLNHAVIVLFTQVSSET